MKIEKLLNEDDVLTEAHFDFEDGFRGPTKVPDLATNNKVALDMWSEWCQIYAGASGLIEKVRSYFTPTKLNDSAVQKQCAEYKKKLSERGSYIKSKLDTASDESIGSIRNDIIPSTNKLLAEVSKFLNKYSESKLKKTLEKQLNGMSKNPTEQQVAIKQAEKEAESAETSAEREAIGELQKEPSADNSDGDATKGKSSSNFLTTMKNLKTVVGDGDQEKLLNSALAFVHSATGQGSLYKFMSRDRKKGFKLAQTLRDTIRQLGEKEELLQFIELLESKVPVDSLDAKWYPNLIVLADNMLKGLYKENNEAITNKSLYSRPRKEFNYALELFNKVSDDKELRKYFPNLTGRMLEKFKSSLFDGNKIKPSGNTTKDSTDTTLHGIVEIFGDVDGGNSGAKSPTKGRNNDETETSSDSKLPKFKDFESAEKAKANSFHLVGGDFMKKNGKWVRVA